jgi:hypothetical protein
MMMKKKFFHLTALKYLRPLQTSHEDPGYIILNKLEISTVKTTEQIEESRILNNNKKFLPLQA